MTGNRGGGVLPSISSSSVWQTPQQEILSKMSCSPGVGMGMEMNSRGEVSSLRSLTRFKTMAFIDFSPSNFFG
jgi:hypothetical protein